VLAITDPESEAAAVEARNDEAEVNKVRGELRPLIVADGRREEIEKLDAFDAAWAEFERVDERLLALAVANTNLKATRLLSRDGAEDLDRFVDGVAAMQDSVTDPGLLRALSRASTAALRSQGLLFAHIPAADAAEMTGLEQRMQAASAEVERSMGSVRESNQVAPTLLASTSHAWTAYQQVEAEVVRLSRQNSNVISFDVSVHAKREATKQCLAALAALATAIDVGPHAPR